MAAPVPRDEQTNYETFRDCLSEPVLRALAAPVKKKETKKARKNRKGRKGSIKGNGVKQEGGVMFDGGEEDMQNAAEDLGDFIEYLASTIFPSLSHDLRTLSHSIFNSSPRLQDKYSTPLSASISTSLINTLPPAAIDSLESYSLLPTSSDPTDQYTFFIPVLTSYIVSATAPPPIWSNTRTTECELCGRSWIPLTYHHLIPKSTHERVLKRKWHAPELLNSVAWLCRACHSFVHRLTSNEGLARDFYNIELIQSGGKDGDKREEVEGWVKWVGGVRWKSR